MAELTERLLSATNHPEAEETLPVVTRFEAVRKNGEEFWAELRISPLLDDDGKPFGSIGALFDVTNSVLAQSRVEAANEASHWSLSRWRALSQCSRNPTATCFSLPTAPTAHSLMIGTCGKTPCPSGKAPPNGTKRRHFDEETSRWFDVRSQRIVWTRGEPLSW